MARTNESRGPVPGQKPLLDPAKCGKHDTRATPPNFVVALDDEHHAFFRRNAQSKAAASSAR